MHGPLLLCLEYVTAKGTKDHAKFPTAALSRESGIQGAGVGVFATKFIKPGRILGAPLFHLLI